MTTSTALPCLQEEPSWLQIARRELGVKETPGRADTPRVLEYLAATRLPPSLHDDETPWCAAFVTWCLRQARVTSTHSASARSYLRWGVELAVPRLGCIVVLARPTANAGSGHVAFWVGEQPKGPVLLGGNQGNAVSARVYGRSRVLSYRWPVDVPL